MYGVWYFGSPHFWAGPVVGMMASVLESILDNWLEDHRVVFRLRDFPGPFLTVFDQIVPEQ